MDPEVIYNKFISLIPIMEKEVESYDSSGNNGIKIHLKDGTIMNFQIVDNGFLFTKN